MKIRNANLKDCKQVQELCKMPGLINPSGKPPPLWWIKSFVKEKQIFFVAEENIKNKKEVIGFIFGEIITGHVAYLWDLGVKKEFQKRGIGKKLLELAEKECKKRKCKAIIAYGYAKSKGALKLLKRRHYKKGEKFIEHIKILK